MSSKTSILLSTWLKAGTAEYLLNWQSSGIWVQQPDVRLDTDIYKDQSNWVFPYKVILPCQFTQIKLSLVQINFLSQNYLTEFELVLQSFVLNQF